MNRSELQASIDQMKEILNDSSIPESTKDLIRPSLTNAEKQLENLKQDLSKPGAVNDRLRIWARNERNVMYTVDITAATASTATRDLIGLH